MIDSDRKEVNNLIINTSMNGILVPREVAELLNVHINTVRRWSNCGILKASRIGPRGDRRFKYEDVISFLENSYPGNYLAAQVKDGGDGHD